MSDTRNLPAFPRPAVWSPDGVQVIGSQAGMSLRDWFAGQALASIMQDKAIWDSTPAEEAWLASRLYRWADAMLAERAKANGNG